MKGTSFKITLMFLTFILLGITVGNAQTYERTFSFEFAKEDITIAKGGEGYYVRPNKIEILWSYLDEDSQKPALPYIIYDILLPDNYKVKSFNHSVENEMWYDGEYTLNVAPQPAPMDEENVNEEVKNSLYPLITYPTDVIYHKEWIQSGYKAARFLINPFTYHANTQKLGMATSVSLNITIEPVDEDEKIEGPKYPESIKSQVYNPEDIDMGTENWTAISNSEFSITGTKWYSNVNYGNFLSEEYGNTTICYSIGEDTIYNGEIWKSFHVDGEYYGAIREQDGQLWIYPSKENQFGLRRNVPTLLYDFSLQVGDVIYTHDFYPGYIKEFSPEEFDEYSLYPITVKDVYEMHGRKVINLEHGIQWIEGIGDIKYPFVSGWRSVASDGSYANEQLYQVVCNGQTIYFNGEFANSQSTPWMKEGMTWTQNWGYSDTSDGQFRQIMLKEEVRPGTFNFDWTESWYNTPYKKLQEFNGKVYAYDDYYHRFDLCYDFTLQEGDEVNLLASYNFEDPTRFSLPILRYDTCIVAKVDSVEIDGTMRKRLTLTGDREDVWIEGIGSLSRVFPIDGFDNVAYSVVYNPSRITCLSNNEESIYLHPSFADCTTPQVDNVPSFTKEYTHIQLNGSTLLCTSPNATKLEVYTMDAVKVSEANFANGVATVKVDETPATYLYIVTYPNGSRESGKVMVK